ncbi:TetR/AcrR family transcriptional regulator [Nocardioides sp. WS12]|uniref:TetR/AcrR family transcriptional regulator n=1 Tax=Nocardioides sp. WS12 TaxID=2486272 RepID=UPI0015FCF09E|nr:TetR/AcrR family transcriptional regulator [Nocardioides sp. WS12]
MADVARKRRPYAARVPMAERREQLLDATLRIIDRDGYDGVSIDAIAKEAGVTRPVVYGAFESLGPLLMALLERQQQRALMQLFGALPQDLGEGKPADLIRQAGPALHQMLLDDPVTWRAILQSATHAPEAVRERVEADREQVRHFVEQLVVGTVGRRADAEVLSHAVIAVLERFGQLVIADPERFTAERLTDAVAALLGRAPRRVT